MSASPGTLTGEMHRRGHVSKGRDAVTYLGGGMGLLKDKFMRDSRGKTSKDKPTHLTQADKRPDTTS